MKLLVVARNAANAVTETETSSLIRQEGSNVSRLSPRRQPHEISGRRESLSPR
jgi:hypothetical protein